MLLSVFMIFLALSIVAIGLGYFTGDDFHALIGLFFLFLLSIVILTGNLEYTTGSVITKLSSTSTSVIDTTANWNDNTSHWIGYGLAITSGFGIIMSFINYRERKKERES